MIRSLIKVGQILDRLIVLVDLYQVDRGVLTSLAVMVIGGILPAVVAGTGHLQVQGGVPVILDQRQIPVNRIPIGN